MSKLFECRCGRKWRVYVGNADTSTCCGLPMTAVDDEPMPPARMTLEDARKLFEDDDDPTFH
jgi:hypothetical protein